MIDNKEDDRRRRRSVEILKSLYLRCFNGFMVSGSRHRSYLESLGVPGDAIREGYSCVANERIGTLASALRAEAKPLAPACDYFLCVSRFVAKKNLEYLVRSYARYKASLRPGKRAWQLVICGDGAEGPAVRRAIAEAGVGEDVTLPGRIDDPRVAVNYYAFCRAFVLPSIEAEQWGLVVNEAMAAGAPVLVSDRCGCAPDLVVPGRNGFCFDPTSEEDLAKQMRWMHDNCHTLPGMGRASMEIIERVSTARFAANVLELCELQAGRS